MYSTVHLTMPEISALAQPTIYAPNQALLNDLHDRLSNVDHEALGGALAEDFADEDIEEQLADLGDKVDTLIKNIETMQSVLAICHSIHYRRAKVLYPPTNAQGIPLYDELADPEQIRPFNPILHLTTDPETWKEGKYGRVTPQVFLFDTDKGLPQTAMTLDDMMPYHIGEIADLNRIEFLSLRDDIVSAATDLEPYLQEQDIDFAPLFDMINDKAFCIAETNDLDIHLS